MILGDANRTSRLATIHTPGCRLYLYIGSKVSGRYRDLRPVGGRLRLVPS